MEKGRKRTIKKNDGDLAKKIKDLEILAGEPVAITFLCEDGTIRFASMLNKRLHRQIEESTSPDEHISQETEENFAQAKEKNFRYIG